MRKLCALLLACAMLLGASAVAESSIFGIVMDATIETGAETVEVTEPAAPAAPAPADASFVFTFRDGITWNTTLDELKAIFPEHELYESDGMDEEEVLGYKAFVSLEVPDVNMGVLASDLMMGMIDGKLVLIGYTYVLMADDAEEYYDMNERFELLKKNLTAKYGEVAFDTWDAALAAVPDGMCKQTMAEEAEDAGAEAKFAAWLLPDNTLIYLCDEELYYVNYLAMDAQVEGLLAKIEAVQAAEQDTKEKEITEGIQNAI